MLFALLSSHPCVALAPLRLPSLGSCNLRGWPRLSQPAPLPAFRPVVPRMAEKLAAVPKVPIPTPEDLCLDGEANDCTLFSWEAGEIKLPVPVADRLVLGALLTAWYALNIMYNITLKRAQNAFPMPWTISLSSLFVGVPFVGLFWASGLRKTPKFGTAGLRTLVPIGAAHALGHAGAVISIGAGAVSFAHTVKAAEPLFTCLLSYFVLGTVFKWQVYASLLPIIAGVSLASLTELSFTYKALWGALTSNLAFSTRAVLSKATMDEPRTVGENMSAPNLYGVLTIIAFVITLPFAVYFEGRALLPAWRAAAASAGGGYVLRQVALNGFFFYAYNEVAFITLSRVSPITHAIANTFKRVCIILVSVAVFGNKLTPLGAGLAVAGTFAYSAAKRQWAV